MGIFKINEIIITINQFLFSLLLLNDFWLLYLYLPYNYESAKGAFGEKSIFHIFNGKLLLIFGWNVVYCILEQFKLWTGFKLNTYKRTYKCLIISGDHNNIIGYSFLLLCKN